MRATSKFLALALTAAMQSAMAGTVSLDFEDVTVSEKLTTRYPGVTASGAAWAVTSQACSYGTGINQHAGTISFKGYGDSCGALMLASSLGQPVTPSPSLTLTLADGFIGTMAFIFASGDDASTLDVQVLDAKGNLLVDANGLSGSSCTEYTFCNWSEKVLSFSGIASSVTFTAPDQTMLLDNITFTTPAANGRLPEPTSIALTLGALAGLGWARKRSAR